MDKTLVIMQGAPGSGKSTVARALDAAHRRWHAGLAPNAIFSTDDFWMKNGEYEFDSKQLGAAHLWNQGSVLAAMKLKYELIIVDNTNIWYRFAKAYFDMATEYGYLVEVVRVDPGLDACISRNADRPEKRRCPTDTVIRMYQSMEDLWQHHRLTPERPRSYRSPYCDEATDSGHSSSSGLVSYP